MLRGCGQRHAARWDGALLQRKYLEGESQRADMHQVGQSCGVWLQELRRQGQQLRGRGGGRLTSRSGSAWSSSTHSRMLIA